MEKKLKFMLIGYKRSKERDKAKSKTADYAFEIALHYAEKGKKNEMIKWLRKSMYYDNAFEAWGKSRGGIDKLRDPGQLLEAIKQDGFNGGIIPLVVYEERGFVLDKNLNTILGFNR